MDTMPEATGHGDKCGARKRDGSGATCRHPAGWGTDHVGIGHCRKHGGNTPNHVTAARAEEARRAVATYGLPRTIDPAAALLEEVHRTAGHVTWLGEKVAELAEDDLVWGVTEEVDKASGEFPGTDMTRAAKPNAWLVLYQQERKHLVDVSAAAIRAGVDAALVRMTEQQGVLLAGVISRVLARLELSPEQRALVGVVVPEELRAAVGS
ncbi:hypothetical protein [Sphaerisporangium siamense]|uniref:Uncharacterized protein n=1 Tax=Sphaerisporangium siamense TaxID=795645 RepID=A0A7W7GAA5_9ACTN|nr:hypothetical protein [Sphaerisporangium siamense]MBB4702217.1 hypothetical protein [Sphaerisporangium siamense]